MVGSFAVLAAASGTLTMPQAGASGGSTDVATAVPARPLASGAADGALDAVADVNRTLKAESTQSMQEAYEAVVERERRDAAEREARAKRERERWVAPLSSYRISATFGSTGRLWSNTHTGVDLSASYGAEVRSLSTGEIIWTGYDGPYGNKIVVRHWDGTETWYCHLSRIIQGTGSTVAPGEVIGAVGSTGNSTGPHLHLEVHPASSGPVNPQSWLAERGVNL